RPRPGPAARPERQPGRRRPLRHGGRPARTLGLASRSGGPTRLRPGSRAADRPGAGPRARDADAGHHRPRRDARDRRHPGPALPVLGLLVAAALAVAAGVAVRRRAAALAAAGVTLAGRRSRQPGLWFFLAALLLLAVAVAGPSARLPVGRSAGTVILAMDVS